MNRPPSPLNMLFSHHTNRRAFIMLLGGAAAWPLAARAQQTDRVRRLGVVTDTAESNPEGQARIAALRQRLHELGWTEGRNLQVDYRWSGGDVERVPVPTRQR